MKNKFLFNKIKLFVFSTLFFSVIVTLLLCGIYEEDKEFSETENRYLANFPSFSAESIFSGRFMSDFENYMSDQFFARDRIVSFKTFLLRVMGNTLINDVYIGTDNRLFEAPSFYDENKISASVAAINSFIKLSDIENKFFVLVPNATEILSEYLPDYIKFDSQKTQIDNIYGMLDDSIVSLDAWEVLNEVQNKEKLYYRTDHHWTSFAAFNVFKQFAKTAELDFNANGVSHYSLSNTFFGTLSSSTGIYEASDSIEIYLPENIVGNFVVHNLENKEKSVSVLNKEKLETKNQYEVFFGGNFSRLYIKTTNMNSKNILIFKDSYANCFIPLLIPYYENIVVIDPRYFIEDINNIVTDINFSDVLFLYNVNTFLEDTVLCDILV